MARSMCSTCQRPERLCYCHLLQPVANHWPVHILQHRQETAHAIGTARIAQLCLEHCQTVLAGDQDVRQWEARLDKIVPAPALIYPGTDSLPLAELTAGPVRPLLFIDASWRKSRRLLLQSDFLAGLPRYALPSGEPSRYRIRREPHPQCRSTLEAIVQTLSALPPAPASLQGLLGVMDWMIDQQLAHMAAAGLPDQHC